MHNINAMPKSIQFLIFAPEAFSISTILLVANEAFALAIQKTQLKLTKILMTHLELRQVIEVKSHLRDLKERFLQLEEDPN